MRFNGDVQLDGSLRVDGTSVYSTTGALPTPQFTNKASNTALASPGGDVPGLTNISFPENDATGVYLVSVNLNFIMAASVNQEVITLNIYVGDGDSGDGAAGLIYQDTTDFTDAFCEERCMGIWRLPVIGMTSNDAIGVNIGVPGATLTIYGSTSGQSSSIEIEPI